MSVGQSEVIGKVGFSCPDRALTYAAMVGVTAIGGLF